MHHWVRQAFKTLFWALSPQCLFWSFSWVTSEMAMACYGLIAVNAKGILSIFPDDHNLQLLIINEQPHRRTAPTASCMMIGEKQTAWKIFEQMIHDPTNFPNFVCGAQESSVHPSIGICQPPHLPQTKSCTTKPHTNASSTPCLRDQHGSDKK